MNVLSLQKHIHSINRIQQRDTRGLSDRIRFAKSTCAPQWGLVGDWAIIQIYGLVPEDIRVRSGNTPLHNNNNKNETIPLSIFVPYYIYCKHKRTGGKKWQRVECGMLIKSSKLQQTTEVVLMCCGCCGDALLLLTAVFIQSGKWM